MPHLKTSLLSKVESAAIDGRLQVLRVKQRLLRSLHNSLTQHHNALVEATESDEKCNQNEGQLVIAAALLELRNHYDALDLKTDLEEEYALAKGKSNPQHSVPISITYIIPDHFTLVFSVISAVAGAIASGSCAVVEVSCDLPSHDIQLT